MKCSGTLNVTFNRQEGKLCWQWTSEDRPTHFCLEKKISDEELNKAITDFRESWEDVLKLIQRAETQTAKKRLDQARNKLEIDIVPDKLRLYMLAERNAILRLVVIPDSLPVEVIPVGGEAKDEPLAAHYRLVHTKGEVDCLLPKSTDIPIPPCLSGTRINGCSWHQSSNRNTSFSGTTLQNQQRKRRNLYQ